MMKNGPGVTKLMARPAAPQVLKVSGPVVIEFPDGTRIQIGPAAGSQIAPAPEKPRGKAGRKPSPATQALVAAMQGDAAAGRPRSRVHYLDVLREAGHAGSANSAGLIVNREAKRIFGHGLGRGNGVKRAGQGAGRRGRGPAPETVLLRAKLQEDRSTGQLGDARHYLGWLMAQPEVKIGLKPARPIVYRELRAVK